MNEVDWLEADVGAVKKSDAAVHRFALRVQRVVERRPWLSFAAFSALYFAVAFALSSMKLLWLDELITLHIAKLGSLHSIWNALQRGVDPNPPLTYLLVHASIGIFGEHEFAYRLPAILGYCVGLTSLFAYLKRLLPATWALAGTVISTTMAAFDYSYESRSYGLFYGLAMLAVFAWSWTVDPAASPSGRRWSLLLMMVALAAGISTNYFAVLAFLPIAGGEAVRTFRRAHKVSQHEEQRLGFGSFWKAVDLRVWIALIVAGLPLLLYRPLIEGSIAEFAPYAWNKVSWGQVFDSYTEMVEMMLYPALALFALALVMRLIGTRTKHICTICRARIMPRWVNSVATRALDALAVPMHEAAAIFLLMAYPILGYLVASVRGGMLSPRFVIPVCFGFAIAITLVAFQLFSQFRPAAVALLGFAIAWLICREFYVGYWYEEQKQCFYNVLDRLPKAENAAPPGSPIVVSDPLMALTFQHYAPPAVASRVIFPVDFPAIRFFRHDDSPEENLWAGRGFLYKLRIIPLADFENSAGRYLVLASDGNWLLDDLRDHHFDFQRLDIDTHAEAIGGFTPLSHGTPAFFIASGGNAPSLLRSTHPQAPVPFERSRNLPTAATYIPPGDSE